MKLSKENFFIIILSVALLFLALGYAWRMKHEDLALKLKAKENYQSSKVYVPKPGFENTKRPDFRLKQKAPRG